MRKITIDEPSKASVPCVGIIWQQGSNLAWGQKKVKKAKVAYRRQEFAADEMPVGQRARLWQYIKQIIIAVDPLASVLRQKRKGKEQETTGGFSDVCITKAM